MRTISCDNQTMFKAFDKGRLRSMQQIAQGEQLRELRFTDAFHDQLSMMALLLDMTASFASSREYRSIPDHCGSLPAFRKPDDRKETNARRRS